MAHEVLFYQLWELENPLSRRSRSSSWLKAPPRRRSCGRTISLVLLALHLNLSLLTFDEVRTAGGPTKGLVQMFINGSATVYDSFNYNPSASVQNKTFSFTPTVDADNVTSVEYRFYGWNGGTEHGQPHPR
jgi:hypothetical protein